VSPWTFDYVLSASTDQNPYVSAASRAAAARERSVGHYSTKIGRGERDDTVELDDHLRAAGAGRIAWISVCPPERRPAADPRPRTRPYR